MKERRRFSRVVYQAPAVLVQGSHRIDASIRDLSLHGVLLACDAASSLSREEDVNVQFSLPGSDVEIQLVAKVVGLNNNIIRLAIDHIAIESIGHLKRLVELNVGDDDLLHRDIEHLSDLGEEA